MVLTKECDGTDTCFSVDKEKIEIPSKAVYRLAIYRRCLKKLEDKGIETVSSAALAAAADVKPAQLRKDLAYFGQFGTRGLGYPVSFLREEIREVLGRVHLQSVILVGVGNLGAALLRYGGFKKEGFDIVKAFDIEPRQDLSYGVEVCHLNEMEEFVRNQEVKLAVLCIPIEAAQKVANDLVSNGIGGILNFSPVALKVPDNVAVSNVDLALELENLSFFLGES